MAEGKRPEKTKKEKRQKISKEPKVKVEAFD
jgi:hypothetical protein